MGNEQAVSTAERIGYSLMSETVEQEASLNLMPAAKQERIEALRRTKIREVIGSEQEVVVQQEILGKHVRKARKHLRWIRKHARDERSRDSAYEALEYLKGVSDLRDDTARRKAVVEGLERALQMLEELPR